MSLKAKKSSMPSRYDADFRAALPALKRAAKKAKRPPYSQIPHLLYGKMDE